MIKGDPFSDNEAMETLMTQIETKTTGKSVIWDPAKGDALQGDVCLFRIPAGMAVDTTEEIEPRGGRLILAEGEVTGHHHAIGLGKYLPQPAQFHDAGMARELDAKVQAGTAKMYQAKPTVTALVRAGELTTDRLAIGVLVVEGAPVSLTHDEHDAITIPPGAYYVGNQREWDAAEERRIAD
jgi:hypothetical protein